MTQGIMHGSRYIANLRPVIESVTASGMYPSPNLFLRVESGKVSKIDSDGFSQGSGSEYTILEPRLSACFGRSAHDGFYLGSAISERFPLYSWHGDVSCAFRVPLDYFTLEAIEKNRESDLTITVYGSVTIAVMESVLSPQSHLGVISGYARGELEVSFKIPQSVWVNDVLGRIGHRKFHLLEIDLSRHCQIHEALEYIGNMEKALNSHEYEKVAVLTRELIDFLSEGYLEKNGISKSERWKRASSKVKHFASLFVHKEKIGREVDEVISIQRSDAEYLLTQSKVIIRYAQEIAASV